MPRLRNRVPALQRYGRGKGPKIYARVKIGGKNHHLGLYGSPEAEAEWRRLIAVALAAERNAPPPPSVGGVTVREITTQFVHYIKKLYRTKSGRDTGTRQNYRPALRLLVALFGPTPAEEFGPLALEAVRNAMIERGNNRKTINEAVSKIRRVFSYAVSRELISERVPLRLANLPNLMPGEAAVPEPKKVPPVEDAPIEATLAHVPRQVADMARLQRLTGMRPGEVVQLRPCDVDRSGEIWRYTPREHKTEHHGIERVISIGPQAQMILRPYLVRMPHLECFSPREAWEGKTWEEGRRREPGDRYSVNSYRRAIARGCEIAFGMPRELRRAPGPRQRRAAGLPPVESAEEKQAREQAAARWRAQHVWHPNQLRHAAATTIRKQFGLEAAQVALGHTKANMTERYAEKNLQLADEVARRLG